MDFPLQIWPLRRGASLLLMGFSLVIAHDGHARKSFPLDVNPVGVSIELTGLFDNLPFHGYYPMRVTIRNDSGSTREWEFSSTSSEGYQGGAYDYRTSFTVENGQVRSFEILVPLITVKGEYASPMLRGEVSGYGIETGNFSIAGGYYNVGFIGLSDRLYVDYWGALTKSTKGSGYNREISGTSLEPGYMPLDWRGYLGFSVLWMTSTEWQELKALEKEAVLDWVSAGGSFHLLDDLLVSNTDRLFPKSLNWNEDFADYGFGTIQVYLPEEQDAMAKKIRQALNETLQDGRYLPRSNFQVDYFPLAEHLPVRDMGARFMISFLVLFSILVGPVNLLVFAKGSKRYRLFITTPVISLVASILLVTYIFFKDGVGGEGVRFRVACFLPEQKKVSISQVQISSTGLLVNSAFDFSSDSFISHFPVFDSGFNSQRLRFSKSDDHYGGNWFRSRSVQAQFLQQVVPTRSWIEKMPPGDEGSAEPVLLSGIDADLVELFYIDEEGRYWKAQDISLGQRKSVKRSDADEFEDFWYRVTGSSGNQLRTLLNRSDGRRGQFYAVAEDFEVEEFDTLSSVNWNHDFNFLMGRVFDSKSAN